jgi:hypothetical protein
VEDAIGKLWYFGSSIDAPDCLIIAKNRKSWKIILPTSKKGRLWNFEKKKRSLFKQKKSLKTLR